MNSNSSPINEVSTSYGVNIKSLEKINLLTGRIKRIGVSYTTINCLKTKIKFL